MAEFGYLVYYKEHPADRAMSMRNQGSSAYEKLPRRQRGTSMCTNLSPVMEDETLEELQKKSKRRFSLDFLFSKKKKQLSKSNDTSKRGSVDSTTSTSSISEYNNAALSSDCQTPSRKPSMKVADLTSYSFT